MSIDAPPTPPTPLYLVLGEEELLVERAVADVVTQARTVDPGVDLQRLRATDLTPVDLSGLLSPSLFADARVVVVQATHEAGKEVAAALVGYAADPVDGIVLVALHAGGVRGRALADALRAAGATVVRCESVPPWKKVEFVRAEVGRCGGTITAEAAELLVEAVGSDLRGLAAAASQLVADSGGRIEAAVVRRYHQGHAEVSGFDVADRVLAGDRAGALQALRWALATGVAPVLVADALAGGIRTMVRVGSASRADPGRMAVELGMPRRRVEKALAQLRSWRPEAAAAAFAVAAQVNAEVKGVAPDAGYALERAVQRMCDAREPR